MSDKSEGPGWWVASDGQWYPPELHPTMVKAARAKAKASTPGAATADAPTPAAAPANAPSQAVAPAKAPSQAAEGSTSPRWQAQVDQSDHVGPRFPDLFKKAMEGSHLADNVSVKYAGDDDRNATMPAAGRSMVGAGTGSGARDASSGTKGGQPAKRKWRKGR